MGRTARRVSLERPPDDTPESSGTVHRSGGLVVVGSNPAAPTISHARVVSDDDSSSGSVGSLLAMLLAITGSSSIE